MDVWRKSKFCRGSLSVGVFLVAEYWMYLAPQVHGDGTTGGYTQQLGGCGLHGPVNVEPPSQHRLSHQQLFGAWIETGANQLMIACLVGGLEHGFHFSIY